MRKWWIIWPLYAGLMGFALGASFFFGMYGRNVTESSLAAKHEQEAANETAKSKKEEADEALAYYTLWLMGFTGVLAFATIGLGIATVGLYFTGEKQLKAVMRAGLRQSRDTKESIRLARDEFLSTHRPKIRIKHCVVTGDIWQNEPIIIALTCVNHGTSDAFLQQIGVKYFVVRNDRQLPIEPEIPAVFGAGKERLRGGLNYTFGGINSGRVLTPRENDAIQKAEARLFCVGYVSYFDGADRMRITGFCRVLTFPKSASIAHRDNCRFSVFNDPDYEYED